MESFNHWNSNVVMVTTLRLTTSALIVIIETRGAAGSRGWSPWLSFSFLKTVTVPVAIYEFSSMPFFMVHLYLCLQCLIPYSSSPINCYLVDANLHYVFNHCCVCSSLFEWPPCQRSIMILMEVSQHAYDMIHYISGLFGYFYVCEIYVNLIWYLYLSLLNKFCLSLSLSLSLILNVQLLLESQF